MFWFRLLDREQESIFRWLTEKGNGWTDGWVDRWNGGWINIIYNLYTSMYSGEIVISIFFDCFQIF